MSGIYGYLEKNNTVSLPEGTLERVANWNKAYGTTGNSEIYGNKALGAYIERLNDNIPVNSIILENDECISVIDAVLYNRDEIFDRLKKKEDIKVSDEELLLEYINKYGYDALKDVNGDFSGAVFSKNKSILTLFRDHMGVRPLFYYHTDEAALFSSDIRGIISVPEVDCNIRKDWIYQTAVGAMNYDQVSTEYENIFCVRPGSYLTFDYSEGHLKRTEKKYWTVGKRKIKLPSDEAYQKRLKELIEDSIKRRLDATSGLVGAELSGGLDSGVISILINRLGRKCVYYSWSDSPEELKLAEGDERYIIQDICNQEKIECHYGNLEMKKNSIIYGTTKETGIDISMDELPLIRYALPAYIDALKVSQTANDLSNLGAKVVFSGHGGDEGVSHRPSTYEMFHYHEYYHFFRFMFSTTHGMKKRISETLKRCKYVLTDERKSITKPYASTVRSNELLKDSFEDSFAKENDQSLFFAYDPIAYIKQGGSRSRLDNTALLGAYNRIRYLMPYLDYRVIDYAVSIPRYQYIRGRKNRYIFREAFKDIMPASLYKVRFKRENSYNSIETDPDWFEEFNQEKHDVIDKLDRKLWEKYLNFDLIDAWKEKGEPKGDDIDKEDFMLICLLTFAAAQNVIDKTRAV